MSLVIAALLAAADAGVAMNSAVFAQKLTAFAKDGGGHVYAVAITGESTRANYTFSHWAGFFSTEALRGDVVRPSPPYLLVGNYPYDRESKNQNVVEEIVRWEPDGTFVSTGIKYSKWGGNGSEQFKAAASKLFPAPTHLHNKVAAFSKGGGGNLGFAAITGEAGRAGYSRQHWAGFYTSTDAPSERPDPPLLLVRSGPILMESRNQNVVEELVRWEPDGSLVSTGIIFSRDDPRAHGSEAFRDAAKRLLKP